MKEIELTRGYRAIVDDEDYEIVSKFKWSSITPRGKPYAHRNAGGGKYTYLHRVIMGVTERHVQVDHKNGNTLDNRRKNLRVCSNRQNHRNITKYKNNTSGFKGVCWDKNSKKWVAQIKVNYKHIFLGRFKSKSNAAITYNSAAIKHFGAFANLNKVEL